jgi:hypothetical protein
MKMKWQDSVQQAIIRQCKVNRSDVFTNEQLRNYQLDRIKLETECKGKTPHQTLNKVLQDLRNSGMVQFVDDKGRYRFLGNWRGPVINIINAPVVNVTNPPPATTQTSTYVTIKIKMCVKTSP